MRQERYRDMWPRQPKRCEASMRITLSGAKRCLRTDRIAAAPLFPRDTNDPSYILDVSTSLHGCFLRPKCHILPASFVMSSGVYHNVYSLQFLLKFPFLLLFSVSVQLPNVLLLVYFRHFILCYCIYKNLYTVF